MARAQNALNIQGNTSGLVAFNGGSNSFSTKLLTSTGGSLNIANGDGSAGNPLITLGNWSQQGITFTSSTISFIGQNPLLPGGSIQLNRPYPVGSWVLLSSGAAVQMARDTAYTINVPAMTTQVLFTLPSSFQPGDQFFIATLFDNTGGFKIQQNPNDKIFFYGNIPNSTTKGTAGSLTSGGASNPGSYVLHGACLGTDTSTSTNIWNVLSTPIAVTLV